MIGIIDCGLGNIGSIVNMMEHLFIDTIVSGDPLKLEAAERLILPGVGAFDKGMDGLGRHGLLPFLHRHVRELGKPVLGICLGMQLMTRSSEEGGMPGLGWIDAATIRLDASTGARIPHMGWDEVEARRPSAIFASSHRPRFYFVHGYGVQCRDQEDVVAHSSYAQGFCSVFQRDNIIGVQFHPEKSHHFGMDVLRRFAEWRP